MQPISVRALSTFTVHWNEASQRYCVTDDQNAGRLVGSGFVSVVAAVDRFATQDARRTLARG